MLISYSDIAILGEGSTGVCSTSEKKVNIDFQSTSLFSDTVSRQIYRCMRFQSDLRKAVRIINQVIKIYLAVM